MGRGDGRRKSMTFLVAVGFGAALAIGTAFAAGDAYATLRGEYTFAAPLVALLCIWAGTAILLTVVRKSPARVAASGLLIGYAAIWLFLSGTGLYTAIDCMLACTPSVTPLLMPTTLVAIGIGVWLLVLGVRVDDPHRGTPMRLMRHRVVDSSSPHRPMGLASGADLISDLERKLGMTIIARSVDESSAPVRITAVLCFGPRSEEVTAIGFSTIDAWRQLAGMAVAWRNANENLVQLWGVGF